MKNRVILLALGVIMLATPVLATDIQQGWFSFKGRDFNTFNETTFSFQNYSDYRNQTGYFSFQNYVFLKPLEPGYTPSWFVFSNNADWKTTNETSFTFQNDPDKPVTNVISDNIVLIIFVVLLTVCVVSFTYFGLRWQRRRQQRL